MPFDPLGNLVNLIANGATSPYIFLILSISCHVLPEPRQEDPRAGDRDGLVERREQTGGWKSSSHSTRKLSITTSFSRLSLIVGSLLHDLVDAYNSKCESAP